MEVGAWRRMLQGEEMGRKCPLGKRGKYRQIWKAGVSLLSPESGVY